MNEGTVEPGIVIADRYELLEKVGDTSIGALFHARDKNKQINVNIQLLTRGVDNDESVQRFFQEVELIKTLKHENLIIPSDVGCDDDIYFQVTESIQGETLEARLKKGTIPELEALSYAAGIANALEYVWQEKEVIHRNIKPENIFITKNNQVKLSDFGLAKSSETGASGLTGDGFTIGTPEYMSPEQIRAEEDLDMRSDMYSLGCALYEMLAGRIPFPDTAPMLIMQKHLDDDPVALSKLNPEISSICSQIVNRMLAKEREERFPAWKDLVNNIEDFLSLQSFPVEAESVPVLNKNINQVPIDSKEIHPVATEKVNGIEKSSSSPSEGQSILNYLLATSKIDASHQEKTLPFGKQTGRKKRYFLNDEIDSDEISRVFLTDDQDLGRTIALKSLLPRVTPTSEILAKFIKEAQIKGHLEHPGIPSVYDIGIKSSGQIYFTSQHLTGISLREVINRLAKGNQLLHITYSWTYRAQIVQRICDVIQFAHSKGIIHTNLKPENILIGKFGEVFVIGWEQAEWGSSSPELDVVSMGAILFEFFSLHKLFDGKSVLEVCDLVKKSSLPPIKKFKNSGQGKVPMEIQYIANNAFGKEPSKGNLTAESLNKEIQLFLEGRYPIRCPQTALKRFAMESARLADNHAILVLLTIAIVVSLSIFFLVF